MDAMAVAVAHSADPAAIIAVTAPWPLHTQDGVPASQPWAMSAADQVIRW